MLSALGTSTQNIVFYWVAVQVLFCTFTSMIGLMLATFSVVVKSGAVRLAGIE